MAESFCVVIPCFREGELVAEAVASARNQAEPPEEILVINDGCAHEPTNAVCRRLEEKGHARILRLEQNAGPARARNAGFEAARGDVLVPLDADDLLPEGAIRTLRAAFTRNPDVGFVQPSYLRYDCPCRSVVVTATPRDLRAQLSPRRLSIGTDWSILGTAPLRKSLWEAAGRFDPHPALRGIEDTEFWMRALALPCTYRTLPEVTYVYRKYLGGTGARVTMPAWEHIARKNRTIYEKLDLEYRADELIVLGARWRGDREAAAEAASRLWRRVRAGEVRASTLLALLLPTAVMRFLFQRLKQAFPGACAAHRRALLAGSSQAQR